MKRAALIRTAMGAVLATSLLVGCGAQETPTTTSEPSTNTTVETQITTISQDEAEETALDHAGFSEAEVATLRTSLDMDDGRQVYEVEFSANGVEYSYDIDAITGEVVSYDVDSD